MSRPVLPGEQPAVVAALPARRCLAAPVLPALPSAPLDAMSTRTTAGRKRRTISIETTQGPCDLPVAWQGAALAVHRPLNAAPRAQAWTITHLASGRSASGSSVIDWQAVAVALAEQWDALFAEIPDNAGAAGWPHAAAWGRALVAAVTRREVLGPQEAAAAESPADPLARLEAAQSPRDIHAAVVAALTGYEMTGPDDPDGYAQFPAGEMVPADRLRNGPDGLEMRWGGRWWPVPAMADVEAWALDSVAETPDGRSVEPDHPEAWTRLLGVV